MANPTAEVAPGRMVTRSLTRRADSVAPPPSQPPQKKPKKTKAAAAAVTKHKEENDVPNEEKEDNKGKSKNAAPGSGSRTIIIERSTICSRFKTRAERVKEGLESAIPGINVIINPEKGPRKGIFEVREEGKDEKFISLVDTKRPFLRLQEVDIEKLIEEIVAQLKG